MILNIITFIVCAAMVILFRRLDKSNLKMAKLRRYSSRMFDDYKKMVETESRNFKDSTIEMDILIKKSNALTKNMGESLIELENRLNGINVEKGNLKKVEDDIKVISSAARDVNKQIEFIAAAKERFSGMTNSLKIVSENLTEVKGESLNLIQDFENGLRDRTRMLTEEMNQKIEDSSDIIMESLRLKVDDVARTVEGAATLGDQIDNLKVSYSDLETSVFSDIKDRAGELRIELDKSIEKIYQKLNSVEDNVDESKDRLIKTFEGEVDRIRKEFDNLSIHAISKKDEIVQAARKEAEEIRERFDDFQEKFINLENQLVNTAEDKIEMLDSEYEKVEKQVDDLEKRIIIRIDDKIENLASDYEKFTTRINDHETRISESLSFLF